MTNLALSIGLSHATDVSWRAGETLPPPAELELTLVDGQVEITPIEGALEISISGTPRYDGTYSIDPADLTNGPVALVPPAITGVADVAETLSADPGLWIYEDRGQVPVVSYQWLKNASPLAGSTDPTYTVAPEDAASTLSLRETVSDTNGSSSSLSAPRTVSGAAPAMVVTLQSDALIGTLFNTTHTEAGLATEAGAHHVVALFLRDDTGAGLPGDVSLGGVPCSLTSDGTQNAIASNTGGRKLAIYRTAGPVSGATSDLQFTVSAYYTEFQASLLSLTAEPTVVDLTFNATAGQNPVDLSLDTADAGAVIVAGLFNGVPTILETSDITLLYPAGTAFQGQGLVLGTLSDTTAASPQSIALSHDLAAQLSFIALALRSA